jgi:hypothetical protein
LASKRTEQVSNFQRWSNGPDDFKLPGFARQRQGGYATKAEALLAENRSGKLSQQNEGRGT